MKEEKMKDNLEKKTITGLELMKAIKSYFGITTRKGWENLNAKRLAKTGEDWNKVKYSDGKRYLIAYQPPITALENKRYRLVESGSEDSSVGA